MIIFHYVYLFYVTYISSATGSFFNAVSGNVKFMQVGFRIFRTLKNRPIVDLQHNVKDL